MLIYDARTGNTVLDEGPQFTRWAPDQTAEISFERGGRFNGEALAKCAACYHQTEQVFGASSESHRIENGSGGKVEANLCAHCWGDLLRPEVGAT